MAQIIPDYITEDNQILIKWFLFPFLIINGLIMTIIPSFRSAGMIYLFLGLLSWVLYYTPTFQDNLIGIRKGTIFKSILAGIGIWLGVWIINRIAPALALGYPSLPASISEDMKWFIIVIIAPIMETIIFDGALLSTLIDLYKLPELGANAIKSGIFAVFHFLAYGIYLGAYAQWAEVFGGVNAILGLLIAAFSASMIFGWVVRRDGIKSLLAAMIGHGLINNSLFAKAIVIT